MTRGRRILSAVILSAAAQIVPVRVCSGTGEDLPGHRDFTPTPSRPVGYRGDWTGRYPGATPPVRWGETSNVVWRVEVGSGEASPVVVGDRIFMLTDGNRVTCLGRGSGAIRWQQDSHLTASVAEQAAVLDVEKYVKRFHQLKSADARLRETEAKIRRLRGEQEQGAAFSNRLAALEKERLDCKDMFDRIEASVREVASASNTVSRSGQPNRYMSQSPVTYAIATPCSDGRRVYFWLPMGAVVSYDLEGRRKWSRVLGDQRYGGGWWGAQVAPSPLLVDGRLIIHYDQIYCLDAGTGKTLWTQKQRLLSIPSPVAGQRNGEWYVGLGTMQILRLTDGKYVHGDEAGGHHDCVGVGSPIFYDGIFCWTSHAVSAPETADGEAKLLWGLGGEAAGRMTHYNHVARPKEGEAYVLRGMGWHGYGSPVEKDGLLLYQHENTTFSTLDAKTGKLVSADKSALPGAQGRGGAVGGGVYPSLTVAGGYVFASGEGGTLVIRSTKEKPFHPVALNRPGPSGGNMLVFSGQDMFLHAGSELYCIRDEGK